MNFGLEIPKQSIQKVDLFKKDLHFYVCSSGGCGSTIIYNYLSNFGNVYHIHDRYPPSKLCYTGSINTMEPVYNEWFNNTEIPDEKLVNYRVIFIYRNPIDVIFSRFALPKGPNIPHMKNIKCNNNGEIYFGDVLKLGKDLYKLEEFFDNYTLPKNRNYPIYCFKYEYFFNNIQIFNKILDIPDIKSLYPVKNERKKTYTYVKELLSIYYSLIHKMKGMRFIEIIPANLKQIKESNDDDYV